jgi:hypothetical protein
LKRFFKKEWIITTIIFSVLIIFGTTNYFYRTKYGLKVIPLEKIKHYFTFKGDVKTTMLLNMGKENILRMDISFPCENKKLHSQLTGNLPAIVSDFLVETDQEELDAWIQHGNTMAIKKRLIKIANKHTDQKVTSVFFEALNW